MGVATVISNVLDFGMDPALAVDVARLDTEVLHGRAGAGPVPVAERQDSSGGGTRSPTGGSTTRSSPRWCR